MEDLERMEKQSGSIWAGIAYFHVPQGHADDIVYASWRKPSGRKKRM